MFYNHGCRPTPARLHTQLKKWLARALRQVFEPERFNKQMLVLVSSGQTPGKTTLLRWLIPTALAGHYCDNPDIADKDARIAIARSLLVSFDEVAVLLRNRHAFKALISAGANTVRLPYTASPTRLERLASFVATSNEYDFIHDETGSVRYLCFEVVSINHSYTNAVDINKLWAQAYALYKSNAPIDLTAEELRENALANHTFTTQPEAAELVRRYFRPCNARELPSHHLSATELKDILSERHAWFRTVPEVSLGKALRALLGPSKSQGDDGVKRYAMIKPLGLKHVQGSCRHLQKCSAIVKSCSATDGIKFRMVEGWGRNGLDTVF